MLPHTLCVDALCCSVRSAFWQETASPRQGEQSTTSSLPHPTLCTSLSMHRPGEINHLDLSSHSAGQRTAGGGAGEMRGLWPMAGPPLQCGSRVLRQDKGGGPDTTSSFALLCETCRGKRSCWLLTPLPTGSYFQLIHELALCLSATGNAPPWLTSPASVARGFHMCSYSGSSLTTRRRPSPSDLRGAFLTLGTFRGSDRAVLPPPSPLAHRRFIELVTRTFHSLAEGHLLNCQPGKGTSEDSLPVQPP